MGLFSITCETCTARLTVRSQTAIGQVLSCPKCGSMLQVEPPPGWVPPQDETGNAAELTQKSAGKTDPIPRRPRDPNDSQATLSAEFGDINTLLDDQAAGGTQTQTQPRVVTKPAIASPPVQPTADGPFLPDEKWTSPQVQKRRKAFAWVAGVLGISVVGLALIGFLIASMFGGSSAPTDPGENTKVAEAKDKRSTKNATDVKSDLVGKADGKSKIGEGAKNTNDAKAVDSATEPNDDTEKSTDPVVAQSDSAGDPASDSKSDAAADSTDKQSTKSEPFDVNDKPDRQAARLDPSNVKKDSIIEEMGDISDLMFDPGINMQNLRDLTADDTNQMMGITGSVFVAKPDSIDYQTEKRLDETFPGVRYDSVPLVKFIRFFHQLTTIPIQLDSRAVMDGRIDPLMKISVNQTDIAARELLLEALTPVGLTFSQSTDSPVIVVTPANSSESVRKEYNVDAVLLANEGTREKLLDLIRTVIDPPSWNVNGGTAVIEMEGDKLVVDQTPPKHVQLERFVNLLAAAARLKQSPEDLSAKETLSTLDVLSQPAGQQVSTFEQLQARPIASVLNQVLKQDGVVVLVDWASIISGGWNPQTESPWPSDDREIRVILEDIATAMRLVVRPLGEQVFEITTPDRLRTATRIEVYPCRELLKKNLTHLQIIKYLENGIASSLPPDVYTPVFYETNLDCVIAILPQKLQSRAERILNHFAKDE